MQMNAPDALRCADEHDAAGRHQEAIVALVLAVRQNDVAAMTRLGKRMLVGDRAPHLPVEAAGFLVEAGQKGSAEALAIVSVLQALGLYMDENLSVALRTLARSAALGWEPAQGQLRALAEDGRGGADRESWDSIAQGIDLQGWLAPPACRTLSASPLVRTFPDFCAPSVCQWLVERSRTRLHRARVYDAVARQLIVIGDRSNSAAIYNLAETDMVNVLVQRKMAACTALPFNQFEAATVLHYETGQQIRDHFDFVDPNVPDYEQQIREAGQRVITFLVYLNDDYAGGETEFPRLQVSHKGKAGEGLYFVNALPDGAADVRTLHAGRPPLTGEKWIVSQFIRDRRVF